MLVLVLGLGQDTLTPIFFLPSISTAPIQVNATFPALLLRSSVLERCKALPGGALLAGFTAKSMMWLISSLAVVWRGTFACRNHPPAFTVSPL